MTAVLDPLHAHHVLVDDVRLMLNHALTTGRQVPPAWLEMVSIDGVPEPAALRRLAQCHDGLSRVIAPATPRSLRYLEAVNGKHTVPVVRHLGIGASVMLVGFVGLATRPEIGVAPDFSTGLGMALFVNLLFQLCAAGLGATFAGLFKVSRHIDAFSFDPRFAFSYWTRVLLGLVSGLVLAQLVPFGDGKSFGRPLLALLGGFSVDVVYKMLNRLVGLVASLVESPAQPGDAAAEERGRADVREGQLKVNIASRLTAVRASLDGEAAKAVDALIADLAASDVAPVPGPTPGATAGTGTDAGTETDDAGAHVPIPEALIPEQAGPGRQGQRAAGKRTVKVAPPAGVSDTDT